jgi:16S rRNA (guanine527-N7)-methyltransferase
LLVVGCKLLVEEKAFLPSPIQPGFFVMNKPQSKKLERNFDPTEARDLLMRGVRALDLNLAPEQINQFLAYLDLLLKWNRKMNLTALRTPAEIISRHFLDSLLLLPHLPETARLLDIGSGAGFPGLPLKIVRPALTIDLAEATAKKVSFLKEAVRCLGFSAMKVFPVFLGEEPLPLPPADPWEFFLSRGVNLEAVLKAVEPFWDSRQRLLLMKGMDWQKEIEERGPLLKKRRMEVERTLRLRNPLSEREWVLVILRKLESCQIPPVGSYFLKRFR